MDVALLLEYSWVLLVLIALEGVLSADNALSPRERGVVFVQTAFAGYAGAWQ